MSNNEFVELSTIQFSLEQVRCSVCKGYLSCGPICILPDGSNICGRCSPLNNDTTYRQFTLETILSDATFPCPFMKYGCAERLLFGQTADHEAKCEYRPLPCVSLPHTTCSWKGSAMQLPGHFADQHADNLKQDAEFTLEVDQNDEGYLMVVKNENAFAIKYLYDATRSDLRYDIVYFKSNLLVDEEVCKIRLTNYSDPDYTIQVKGSKFVLYNQNVLNMQSATVLPIKKLLENLKNPPFIMVSFNLGTPININLKTDVATKQFAVNYDLNLLESKKCQKCHYFLIPPVYEDKDGIICLHCSYTSDNCKPTSDEKLQLFLAELIFPCRWHGCDFLAKGCAIHSHEIECENRVYRCIYSLCSATFKKATLVTHLESHAYRYFTDKFIYKTCFGYNNSNYGFTVVKHEIILIEFKITHTNSKSHLSLQTSSLIPEQFTANVYFEHSHCKCKSNIFSTKQEIEIHFSNLPSCFKPDDQLTVTIVIK